MKTTWDGLPIHPEKPFGATVVVYRHGPAGLEFLVLHRAHKGPDFEGDWAWTPPSGARQPDETIAACARRELFEETGLVLPLQASDIGTQEWVVFTAPLERDEPIRLSAEHDRFAWLPPAQAIVCCKPDIVSRPIRRLAESL